MAFFFDLCDYLASNLIGVDTIEANCINFEDMASTARETRNAYVKALDQYIKSATSCDVDGTCDSIIQEKIYTDFYQGSMVDYYTKSDIFWNMLFCDGVDKKTGLEYTSMRVPTINGEVYIDVDYVVDYGDGSFNMSNVIAYQDSMVKFMCDIKNIMVLIMGETFEETTFTEFYSIGSTTTTTTIAPTTTTTTTISTSACPCVGGNVIIGTQTWACENSNISTYRDGTEIPEVTGTTEWASLTTGAWCYYNNDPANGAIYGKLYNWYAVAGIYDAASLANPSLRKQFAPSGYHVPSFTDMIVLTDTTLGGQSIAGRKMKEVGTTHWNSPNDATNSSCFTALGGGYRWTGGNYMLLNGTAYWWSSTSTYVDYGTSMFIANSASSCNVGNSTDRNYGFSVRLIKD